MYGGSRGALRFFFGVLHVRNPGPETLVTYPEQKILLRPSRSLPLRPAFGDHLLEFNLVCLHSWFCYVVCDVVCARDCKTDLIVNYFDVFLFWLYEKYDLVEIKLKVYTQSCGKNNFSFVKNILNIKKILLFFIYFRMFLAVSTFSISLSYCVLNRIISFSLS